MMSSTYPASTLSCHGKNRGRGRFSSKNAKQGAQVGNESTTFTANVAELLTQHVLCGNIHAIYSLAWGWGVLGDGFGLRRKNEETARGGTGLGGRRDVDWDSSLSVAYPLETIEAKIYDLRARLRNVQNAGEKIAIVAIDEPSVAQLGRYPWPRSRIAEGLDVISEAGPKVIGLDILYPDPEQNQGLAALKNLQGVVSQSSVALVGKAVTLPAPAVQRATKAPKKRPHPTSAWRLCKTF